MLKPTGYINCACGSYSKNPTMQVIGEHCFPCDTDAAKECQIVINAHKDKLITPGHRSDAICQIVMDVFILGMIYGKREERRKRAERARRKARR